ncbi:hypothetical protein [Streptomyces longisporoflavus]|uniref:Uncharacterized protein n=1 Tax=Streptomyces longisporoflavus TaxID=28044 RepID=A0ABW7R3D8_9ACTN
MDYALLTTDGPVPDAMPEVLSRAFGVPVSQTDVSDASELESRNWDALVTCEHERLHGDLTWSLFIYATARVQQRPTEQELAALLAQRLNAPVFFESAHRLPWIRQVAAPGGGLTLARVFDTDTGPPGLVVEAAEAPIAAFPALPIEPFPEVGHGPSPGPDRVAGGQAPGPPVSGPAEDSEGSEGSAT